MLAAAAQTGMKKLTVMHSCLIGCISSPPVHAGAHVGDLACPLPTGNRTFRLFF
jgi:hypothetical protein